ncbi:cytochrome B5 [Alkaliphilus serpentinus]|uniref:Cytochrome B5 n=2 Tax=Alkaliphilus serpentinus TaxID=1482731 RepID=A0A833HQC4_9FIRM|nr:cytochrome B5 [Alkaliphilus serpentinus]
MSFTVACSSNEKNQVDTQELPEFTLEELAEYDGKEGKPAYIAVDGIIYDVTDVREWKDGQHNGFEAGKDLTEAIKNQSPHGVSKLKNIKAVGKLVD